MSDDYTYVVHTPGPSGDPLFGTRHEAVGEKAILDSINGTAEAWNTEIRTRDRLATDPVGDRP